MNTTNSSFEEFQAAQQQAAQAQAAKPQIDVPAAPQARGAAYVSPKPAVTPPRPTPAQVQASQAAQLQASQMQEFAQQNIRDYRHLQALRFAQQKYKTADESAAAKLKEARKLLRTRKTYKQHRESLRDLRETGGRNLDEQTKAFAQYAQLRDAETAKAQTTQKAADTQAAALKQVADTRAALQAAQQSALKSVRWGLDDYSPKGVARARAALEKGGRPSTKLDWLLEEEAWLKKSLLPLHKVQNFDGSR